MQSKFFYFLFPCALLLFLAECKKESLMTEETDATLLAKASATSGFTYYKNSPLIYRSSPQSGHTGYFRVRFNDIALNALTDGGKLPAGGTFPAGSLVVKELHGDSAGTDLIGYAVMEKLPADSNANQGWLWGEYVLSGAGGTRISSKGNICVSCHSMNDRDKIRVFNLFP